MFVTALGLTSLLALPACMGGGEDDVVLYVSADSYVAEAVIDRFEETTGLSVAVVGDTEGTKTTGLAERLRAEADNPRADVFWSSECFMMIQLSEEGVLAPYESDAMQDWPGPRDSEGLWYGFAERARVIVYAPDRVSEDELPQTWSALSQQPYRDRIVMADPRFGTTRGHLGAIMWYFRREFGTDDGYDAWLQGLAANNVRLLTSGNAGVVRAVASGEADFGLTDTDDVWAARRSGMNVDLIYPAHGLPGESSTGTLLIPNTVARIRGGPNPDAAAELIDFLLSAEVERILAESDSHNIPVRDEVAAEYSEYAVEHRLAVDYTEAAALMDEAVSRAMNVLDAGSSGGE